MTTTPRQILADLDAAQNRLTALLLADVPDHPAICEAADVVARLERQAAAAERGHRLTGPTGPRPGY